MSPDLARTGAVSHRGTAEASAADTLGPLPDDAHFSMPDNISKAGTHQSDAKCNFALRWEALCCPITPLGLPPVGHATQGHTPLRPTSVVQQARSDIYRQLDVSANLRGTLNVSEHGVIAHGPTAPLPALLDFFRQLSCRYDI